MLHKNRFSYVCDKIFDKEFRNGENDIFVIIIRK